MKIELTQNEVLALRVVCVSPYTVHDALYPDWDDEPLPYEDRERRRDVFADSLAAILRKTQP